MKSALLDVYCNFCASRQLIFKKAGYELSSMTKVNSIKEKILHPTVESTAAYLKSRI